MINIKDYTTEQKTALLKKYKKFVLTGTHNSGKSTVLNKYAGVTVHYLTNVSEWTFSGNMKEIQESILIAALESIDLKKDINNCKYEINWINDYSLIELKITDNRIKNPLFFCVGEMIRELSKAQGFCFTPSNIVEYLESENSLFGHYKSMYEKNHYKLIDKYFLYDRNITDPLYYIKNTIENDLKFNNDATREQKKYLSGIYDYGFKELTRMKYEGLFDETLFLLLDPINEITDDGFRIIDPVVQTNVYNIAVAILESVRVDYISLSANKCIELLDLVDNVKWN